MPPHTPLADRFWAKVDKTDTCWIWTGAKTDRGYGHITNLYVLYSAHRLSWTFAPGEIPEGMEIDHLCRNRACVNPDHLEVVTHKTNVLRGEGFAAKNAAKTHCGTCGLPYDEANTYNHPSRGRVCRNCNNKGMREYRKRNAH